MKIYSLVHAATKKEFALAENFLSSEEKKFLTLMTRIQNCENCIYLIRERDKQTGQNSTVGIFSFTSGRTFTPYIPNFTKPIYEILKQFLSDKDIFCLVGTLQNVTQIENIVKELHSKQAREKRNFHLMEFCSKKIPPQIHSIITCSKKDIQNLMPLHIAFVNEEVMPHWKQAFAAAELLNLQHIVKNHYVAAIMQNQKIVAKAQTNANTKNFLQIGGVYTLPEYRGKGFARQLVTHIALVAREKNKGCILYVRHENKFAIQCYKNAGFVHFDELCMYYF